MSMQTADQDSVLLLKWKRSLRVVVLNWNLPSDTLICIDSLLAAGLPLAQTIVVDNGSSDDSVAQFYDRFGSELAVIELPENRGYAGGINPGIEYALADGAEWVLALNNDTEVNADFFEQMGCEIANTPGYHLWSPLILYADDPQLVWSLGDNRLFGTLLTRDRWRNRRIDLSLPSTVPVDFLTGCSLLVSRKVFEEVGMFDDSFFMYAEDVDFCLRVRSAGFRMACATRARIVHHVSRSSVDLPAKQRRWRTVNQIRVYKRNSKGLQRWFLMAFTGVRAIAMGVADIRKQNSFRALPNALSAWITGWWNAPR